MTTYIITTWYSDEDQCFFANEESFQSVSAFGDTEPDAVKELIICLNDIDKETQG